MLRRKLFICFFVLSIVQTSFSQSKFGLSYGPSFPDFSFQTRLDFKLMNSIELNAGLDFNASFTLGRILGLSTYYNFGIEKNNSILFGLDLDYTSSGIYGYGKDVSDAGNFLIPKTLYIVPKLGYRFYFPDFSKQPSIFRDFAICVYASYKYRLTEEDLTFREGVYSIDGENNAQNYLNGGLNFSLKITSWFNNRR